VKRSPDGGEAWRRARSQAVTWLAASGLLAIAARSAAQTPPVAIPPAPPAPNEPTLSVGGWLQTDWVVRREASLDEVDPSTGAPLNEERILLRRARARLDARHALALGRIELDLNSVRGLEVRPFEASVALGWSSAGAARWIGVGREEHPAATGASTRDDTVAVLGTVGLFRIPFGFDAVESPLRRPVLERTRMSRALFPGQRDFGVGVDAEYRSLRVSGALMNGAPIGDAGAVALDFTSAKDVLGRFGVDARIGPLVRVEAGFSGLYGRGLHLGTAGTKDALSWQDGNEDGLVEVSELGVIPGTPATPSETFDHFALGADVRLTLHLRPLGALLLRAELIRAQNLDRGVEPADPVATGRDLRELGWVIGVAQELGGLGSIAAQYELYDPDADARGVRGAEIVPRDARYTTLSIAGAVRLSPLRFIAQYDHEGNTLGRGPSGEPTTLDNDGLTLRAELVF